MAITIEIAQSRIYQSERDITILEWNGSAKKCKAKCNKCGCSFYVEKGASLYNDGSAYKPVQNCVSCELIRQNDLAEKIVKEKDILKEGSTYDARLLCERFNFEHIAWLKQNVLDRVCEYSESIIKGYGMKKFIEIDKLYDEVVNDDKRKELEAKYICIE